MASDHQTERIVAENRVQPEMCLVSLTEEYLAFLGTHDGSLQPTCDPGNGNKPHATKTVGYTLALEDLRKTITLAGLVIKLINESNSTNLGNYVTGLTAKNMASIPGSGVLLLEQLLLA